jgi:cytoskeletal protein CcmA (bactofilin family)
MGTGYTRTDVSNNIASGNIINASDLDNEYDAIEAAFNSSTGHTHDGTAAEGGAITVVGPVQDLVVSATEVKPKTTNTLDLGTSALLYKDAYLQGNMYFRDTALKIVSSADGQLDIDADVELELVAPTVDIDASTALTVDTASTTFTSTLFNVTGSANITGDLDVDNININGNTIISTDTNGDINISPDGTGTVVIDTDLDVDNINVNGNTVSSTDTNGNINLSPNGTGTVVINTDLDVDNININGNTIISTDTNGNIALTPNGTGEVDISKVDIDSGTIDGVTLGTNSAVTEAQVDNININGNTISSTDTNGNLTLAPNGTGVVALSSTDLTFGDNDKALFGAGSDLQIFHDGSNSFIDDAGTGV